MNASICSPSGEMRIPPSGSPSMQSVPALYSTKSGANFCRSAAAIQRDILCSAARRGNGPRSKKPDTRALTIKQHRGKEQSSTATIARATHLEAVCEVLLQQLHVEVVALAADVHRARD